VVAGDVGLTILIGLGSGALSAAGFMFLMGRKYQRIEDRLEGLEAKDERVEKQLEKVETDVNTLVKEEGESWQEVNRTLGQIQGALGLIQAPTHQRMKSRP
jgi:hypothetical protein